MALLDNNAAVYERVWYTPYGEARHHWRQEYEGDRDFEFDAALALIALIGSRDIPIMTPSMWWRWLASVTNAAPRSTGPI